MTENNGHSKRLPLDPLLLGLYTWLSTVAVPAFASDAPAYCRWLSAAAIVPLATAWWIGAQLPVVADCLLGIGFFGFSFATWVTLGHARLVSNLADLRTGIGAIAWALLAVAWVRSRQAARLVISEVSPNAPPKGTFTSLGLRGNLQLWLALVLVFAVFWRVGLPSGDGRGAFVTSIALGWSIWMVDTSGLLAARLEHQSKGLGAGLFREGSILVALALAGAGLFLNRLVVP